MSLTSNIRLNENGSGTVSGNFGNIGIPTTAKYSLNNDNGTIMNNLDDVEIPGFTNSYTIELSGADLSIPNPKLTQRHLLIKITYGGDKEDTEELSFPLNKLVGIKQP